MRNATEKLNQEIEYLDTMLEYLIKEELLDLALELRDNTVRDNTVREIKKEKTKKNLKHYLRSLEASYIKR